MTFLVSLILGASWRTSLVGLLGSVLGGATHAAVAYAQGQSGIGWTFVGWLIPYIVGRIWKDGAPKPATP